VEDDLRVSRLKDTYHWLVAGDLEPSWHWIDHSGDWCCLQGWGARVTVDSVWSTVFGDALLEEGPRPESV
jgi:hypothetical protein